MPAMYRVQLSILHVLMDVGVSISRPVAGVACGLVTRKGADTEDILEYKILTDISVRPHPPSHVFFWWTTLIPLNIS